MFDGTFGRIAGVQPDAGGRRIGRQGHARPRSGVGLPLPASPRAGSGRRPLRHLRPAHAQALPRRRRTAFERGEQRIERARPPRGEREEAVEVPADLQVEQGGGLLDETPRAAGQEETPHAAGQELQVALALHVVPDLVEAPGAAPWMCRSRSPRPRTRSAVSTLPTRSRTRRSPSASSASTMYSRNETFSKSRPMTGKGVDTRRLAGEGGIELVPVGEPQGLRDGGKRDRISGEVERGRDGWSGQCIFSA